MRLLLKLLLNTLAVLIASYMISGIFVYGFWAAFAFAVVLGIVNIFIKPIILLLTLPLNVLTLGLFTIIINGLMVELAAALVPGFEIFGFGHAVLFGIVLWIIIWLFDRMLTQTAPNP